MGTVAQLEQWLQVARAMIAFLWRLRRSSPLLQLAEVLNVERLKL